MYDITIDNKTFTLQAAQLFTLNRDIHSIFQKNNVEFYQLLGQLGALLTGEWFEIHSDETIFSLNDFLKLIDKNNQLSFLDMSKSSRILLFAHMLCIYSKVRLSPESRLPSSPLKTKALNPVYEMGLDMYKQLVDRAIEMCTDKVLYESKYFAQSINTTSDSNEDQTEKKPKANKKV